MAQLVCSALAKRPLHPAALLEPTCGLGSLLLAGMAQFASLERIVGADINPTYVKWLRAAIEQRAGNAKAQVFEADFFVTDWERVLAELPQPILVLGNLPWVTNSQLSALGSQNLPTKSNFQNRTGIDAITGKANFDISEWMLIRLIEAMKQREGTLAMLCKTAVARKALRHGWETGIEWEKLAVHRIDAGQHFNAAVDAALLVADFRRGANDQQAVIYQELASSREQGVVAYEEGSLIADLGAYQRWKQLCGGSLKWRSGIKHDCSKVMELRREGGKYRNGLGEIVELEDAFLYPMAKSSHIANAAGKQPVWVIVTQMTVGEDTSRIKEQAPKTWAYLTRHADRLDRRSSAIYRNRPRYSMFGVGDYTFAPWKVAVSGLYKRFAFTVVGPLDDKPCVLDDTSYFLPCNTKEHADYLASLLMSPPAQSFYSAFVFWDAKRPITADLLQRLDVRALAREMASEQTFDAFFGNAAQPSGRAAKKRRRTAATLPLWAD
ncbi:MAG: SAM-dependent DNA methyltransferase [Planctomycetes bacterium]|nr:SAM-dependent DNA methyltransferase [Planctomycetota bacterium]